MSIYINKRISLDESEIEFSAIRAQGSGGQNVNKVNSAVHLRFDISASSLPEKDKKRLLARNDRRISENGIIIIKAQQSRSQFKNREEATNRLVELIRTATIVAKKRKATKPTKAAKEIRPNTKNIRSKIKNSRKKVSE